MSTPTLSTIPTSPTPAARKKFGSPQSMRLLGRAIAFASLTGLLAYGCEKSQTQQAPPEPKPAPQAEAPKAGAPAPTTPNVESPKAETPNAADPGTHEPTPDGPPPTLVISNEPPKPADPQPEAPAAPRPTPIPHDELAKDIAHISEFTTPTNVIVQEIKRGEGMPTLPKAVVTMHFVLRLKDGWKKIQSTWEDGAPETYNLDEVVYGMGDGIIGMQPGATRRIIVPPDRAFGDRGAKNKDGTFAIPPGATLVYDVDLISNKQKIVEGQPAKPAPAPKFNSGRKDEAPQGK